MHKSTHLFIILPLVMMALAACRDRGTTPDEIPTRIPSVEMLATSEFMTQNAPPPGFRESVSFPQIDDQLTVLPSWRYESVMQFNGVFARTPREVDASASADVWYSQLGRKRRVMIEGAGALFGQTGDTALEGVRLSEDTYLVRDHVCVATGSEQATLVADLRAGDLIGGVTRATPTGRRATINGQEVWHYTFALDDLTLPQVEQGDDSLVTLIGGELWVAPEQNAVIRFYANLDVENVVLRLVDNTLPLTGTLILRYDLYDIGVDPNITQPFGC